MLQRLAAYLRRPATAPLVAAVRCVSSGSMNITAPLNFWAGKRRTSQEKRDKENVYEPATGKPHIYLILQQVACLLTLLFPNWTLVTGSVWWFQAWENIIRHFGVMTSYFLHNMAYIWHLLTQESQLCTHTVFQTHRPVHADPYIQCQWSHSGLFPCATSLMSPEQLQ